MLLNIFIGWESAAGKADCCSEEVMIDPKVKTLLALVEIGNYTKTAQHLSLTQPAVSHHIRQIEEEYEIKIFHSGKKTLSLTPEGEVLVKYAKRLMAIEQKLTHALEDSKNSVRRYNVGTTTTVGEYVVSQLFITYCSEHPGSHINIVTDNMNNLLNKLQSYELDWAIVDGRVPTEGFESILLGSDYLCLVVSPLHPFAKRKSVSLAELKNERFILRSPTAGTRARFESYLLNHAEDIRNFNILIEIDNINTIKELVYSNLGITVMSHSACREEETSGRLVTVPVVNFNVTREINIIYHHSFEDTEVLGEIRKIYNSRK